MKSTRVSVKILDASNLPSSSTSTLSPALLTANVWVGGLHEKVNETMLLILPLSAYHYVLAGRFPSSLALTFAG